jgi:hypothetical protein
MTDTRRSSPHRSTHRSRRRNAVIGAGAAVVAGALISDGNTP